MKKINPRKRPATEADVIRARNEGISYGVEKAMAIMLTVLLDKYNAADYIVQVWQDICKYCVEIDEGRVSVPDLERVLREEYEVYIG